MTFCITSQKGTVRFLRNRLSARTEPTFTGDCLSKFPTHDIADVQMKHGNYDLSKKKPSTKERSERSKWLREEATPEERKEFFERLTLSLGRNQL